MRELKFRASIEVNRKPLLTYSDDIGLIAFFRKFEYDKNIEQYTGLKDRNGKEIYEGDIVRQSGSNLVCPVKFEYGGFVPFTSDMMTFDNDYCEVIGNVHESPELLKGEE